MSDDFERISVETPESVAFAFDLAGLGSRGLAFLIDLGYLLGMLVAEAAAFLLVWLLAGLAGSGVAGMLAPWVGGAFIVTAFVTVVGYFVYGEVFRNGRTPGKRRLGIRVVRDDGSRLSAVDSFIRTAMRIVDALPGNFTVGMTAILLSRNHKRLGDMVAGTVVVRDSGELPRLYGAGETSEREALAREYLDRRAGLTQAARVQVGNAVLRVFGEEPAGLDEEAVGRRLAELAGPPEAAGERVDGAEGLRLP